LRPRRCGARHDALSQGVLDPLYAEAIVIQAGEQKRYGQDIKNTGKRVKTTKFKY
jgi:hypothetical protein